MTVGNTGYRISYDARHNLAHKLAPLLFSERGNHPRDILDRIAVNPAKEKTRVADTLMELSWSLEQLFGSQQGLLALGTGLLYAAAPELLDRFKGHPGLWITGKCGTGKTLIGQALMAIWGFPADYQPLLAGRGTTAAALDRSLAHYRHLPMHLDEFRRQENDSKRIAALRGAFNRQKKQQGLFNADKKTRVIEPTTTPLITGENFCNDAATLSRFLPTELVFRPDPNLPTRSQICSRLKAGLDDYHLIGRWLMMHRRDFADNLFVETTAFIANVRLMAGFESIPERILLTHGLALCAIRGLMNDLIPASSDLNADTIQCWQESRAELLSYTLNLILLHARK
jgi:hypothetical protein